MKRFIASLCLCLLATGAANAASSKTDLQDRIEAAKTVLDQIMQAKDQYDSAEHSATATCVGVVPGMIKGAFVFGAQYGQGVVTCRTGHGWSAPVFIRMAGGSWGFQIGGQSTDLILVAVNDRGFQDLLKNKFKIGADASAAAGPVGRAGQAATDWKMNAELLSYSRNKGLFAGISLDGTSVSQNKDDTEIFYGAPQSFDNVLKGNVGVPAGRCGVCAHRGALLFAGQAEQVAQHFENEGRPRPGPPLLVFRWPNEAFQQNPPQCPKLVFASNDAANPRVLAGGCGGARTWAGCRAGWHVCSRVFLPGLVYRAMGRLRRVGERNLSLALPDLPAEQRERHSSLRLSVIWAGNSSSSAGCPTTHARTRKTGFVPMASSTISPPKRWAEECWCSPGTSVHGNSQASTTR